MIAITGNEAQRGAGTVLAAACNGCGQTAADTPAERFTADFNLSRPAVQACAQPHCILLLDSNRPLDPRNVLELFYYSHVTLLIPGVSIVSEPSMWNFMTSPPSPKRPAGSGGRDVAVVK